MFLGASEVNFKLNPVLIKKAEQYLIECLTDTDIHNKKIEVYTPNAISEMVLNGEYIENSQFNKDEYNRVKELIINNPYTSFSVHGALSDVILKLLPKNIKDPNPTVMVQHVANRNAFPHRDFERTASLFYLIESNGADTIWYDHSSDDTISNYRIKNPHRAAPMIPESELTEVKRIELKEHTWYVFDNFKCHAVKLTEKEKIKRRLVLTISFKTIPANELYQLMTENNTH